MSIPAAIRLRPGYDHRYLNIDVAGVEVDHLRLTTDGHVISRWAEHLEARDLVTLVERCSTALQTTSRC
jgi:hypothetical protein